MTVRFVDLFAGIGGLRLGFQMALKNHQIKYECVLSCELHPKAQETYQLNFAEKPYGDIKELASLPDHDVLLAGFPCQAFSYAGSQKGFADTRGTLFFEIERLLKATRRKPKILLLENVRGFTTHDKGRTFATVKSHLQELGYGIQTLMANSAMFGVPQNRVRAFIVCVLDEEPKLDMESDVGFADSHVFKQKQNQKDLFDGKKREYKTVGDILEIKVPKEFHCSKKFQTQLKLALGNDPFDCLHGVRLIDSRGGNSIHSWDLGTKGECTANEKKFMKLLIQNRRQKRFGTHQDGKSLTKDQIATFWDNSDLDITIQALVQKGYLSEKDGKYNPVAGNMSFEVFKFLDPSSISITVVSTDAHRLGVVQNGVPRRITPRECARLQGFPDSFVLHPEKKWVYHQMGNSVSVPVVSAIASELLLKHWAAEMPRFTQNSISA